MRRMGTNGCHWHKMRLFHLNTTNGSATVYGSVTDVTERMEYMEALRKSEQRFEMTLEASGTVVFELDIPTRTARYSEFLQQAFGLAETVANAPEGFIEQGTVAEESIEDFRAIYRDLYAGAPRTSRDASGHAERDGRARQGRRPRGKRHARDGDGSFAEASRSFRARLRITPSARRARTVS